MTRLNAPEYGPLFHLQSSLIEYELVGKDYIDGLEALESVK